MMEGRVLPLASRKWAGPPRFVCPVPGEMGCPLCVTIGELTG